MAKYDLSKEHDKKNFKARCNKLFQDKALVELKDESNRSGKQNRYLHVLITAFAIETGYTLEIVKRQFYKLECNSDIYLRTIKGELGEKKDLRSSASLTKEEMTLSIERFRDWASKMGYYLPEPNEEEIIRSIEVQWDKLKRFITARDS